MTEQKLARKSQSFIFSREHIEKSAKNNSGTYELRNSVREQRRADPSRRAFLEKLCNAVLDTGDKHASMLLRKLESSEWEYYLNDYDELQIQQFRHGHWVQLDTITGAEHYYDVILRGTIKLTPHENSAPVTAFLPDKLSDDEHKQYFTPLLLLPRPSSISAPNNLNNAGRQKGKCGVLRRGSVDYFPILFGIFRHPAAICRGYKQMVANPRQITVSAQKTYSVSLYHGAYIYLLPGRTFGSYFEDWRHKVAGMLYVPPIKMDAIVNLTIEATT